MKLRSNPNSATDMYFQLVRRFPLRRIRSQAEYDQAIKLSGQLLLRDDANLDEGELQYLDALTCFITDYQLAQRQADLTHLTPLEKLKHLMDESGMRNVDLGRLLGSQPAASLILNGKRQLSKTCIRKLAERFKVDAGYFI